MRIRGVVLLLLLIMASAKVLAFDTVFNDYVYSLDTFTREDDLYLIGFANNEEVMIIHKNDDEVFYVHNGTCEETDYYQYCYMGEKLDYKTYGKQIPNTYSWESAKKLEIYSKKPSIKISRSAESEINQDDKTTVRITIQNNGELDIRNMVYEEVLSDNVVITNINPDFMSRSGQKLRWEYSLLRSDDSIFFEYTLKPSDYENLVMSTGNLSYIYSDSNFTTTLASATIKINSPFTITSKTDKTSLGIEEEFTYTYTVTNEDWSDRLYVDYHFEKPQDVVITSRSQELPKKDVFDYEFSLSPSESKTLTIKMQNPYVGNVSVYDKSVLEMRGEVSEVEHEINISTSLPLPEPELKLSKSEVFEGSPYTVWFNLKNDAEVAFYEISGTISSDLFGTRNINYPIIGENDELELFKEVFSAIPVDEATTYEVFLRGHYKSENKQVFNFEKTAKLKVKPVTIGFDIIKTASKKEVVPGDNITVTVKVRNLGQSISIIELKENISDAFRFVSGWKEKTLTLDIDAEEEFYIYKLSVPQETPSGEYVLKTLLDYGGGIISDEEDLIITVKGKTVEDLDEVVIPPRKTQEEEKGFFASIVDFFVKLFKGS